MVIHFLLKFFEPVLSQLF